MKKRLSPYGGIIRIRFNGSDLSQKAPLSKRRQKYKKKQSILSNALLQLCKELIF